MQERLVKANKIAWETKAYEAWVRQYGTPVELAETLRQTGSHNLRYWLKYIGDPAGKRVLNLLGSHGRKAIALAMRGAEVTVVDLSAENQRFALDVAAAAGIKLDYVCSDALSIPDEEELGQFDIVLMEFGVLHYFTDLHAIFAVVRRRLRTNGRFLLTDFHPFARAWLTTSNHAEPSGNYFDKGIKESDVAFAKLLPEEEREGLGKVLACSWTIGDILTAAGTAGLFIRTFEEIPASSNPNVPEFYTLVADKVDIAVEPLYPNPK
ncbi:2-polyprenyl-3-methyl-5-hydroxy-6-metoxy-1,4-benzoquinol methylase [Paenibacillus sp. BK033]|uniref:class I SAM-dependent methyltransferase n=1 Tax=Paenibacillus sp. BK033 TaxID=2512133 RepID=UPI00104E1A40|nr:class I SAM-dependent methyltransferase [Paenibacillus sp. BK033]TCM98995.1 2-polyprenyl-3-methyl-5-hydroxy-6-metoxy-1,4-benzoquinol methylase [Paenibacillus sp. BK033]